MTEVNTGSIDVKLGQGNDRFTDAFQALIEGGPGRDTLSGTVDGYNTLDYSDQTVAVAVSYDGNPNNDGPINERDVVSLGGFRTVVGEEGNDTLSGDGGVQIFYGNAGDDRLTGGPNDDELYGGPGRDTLNGGPGYDILLGNTFNVDDDDGAIDTADYADRTDDLTIHVGGASASEDQVGTDIAIVIGGAGNDHLVGSAKAETLIGNAGRDTLDGNGGDDSLLGNDGDDQLLGNTGADTSTARPTTTCSAASTASSTT